MLSAGTKSKKQHCPYLSLNVELRKQIITKSSIIWQSWKKTPLQYTTVETITYKGKNLLTYINIHIQGLFPRIEVRNCDR